MRRTLVAACPLLIAFKWPWKLTLSLFVVARNASEASQDKARYYARFEHRPIFRRLLRTEGGGPDTPFTDEDLFRDFRTFAFFSEYVSGQAFIKAKAQPAKLSKWIISLRVRVLFGPSFPVKTHPLDTETIETLL